ncbi:TarQ [Arthrobacter crystallopoietes BAB-32]|uniref:TarQ n=1 Tax=Arthrobacter crystallopoietes BAB-32 TaxID=1246476 RepID=N1V2T7_9MICC|nr:glycosyltransferase family 2 protein [Arthrobacter crystallopoietes]EMY34372.1 TarQ [Arthrobacter crystallopoietes BAB-32]
MRVSTLWSAVKRRLRRELAARLPSRMAPGDTGASASARTAQISVVIPVYNALPYLEELLESLSHQDLDPELFEVIAVDDGSTDRSGDVLEAYAQSHPNCRVIHQPNSGWPGQPRNVGIDVSQAPYVFFCDADDVLGSESLRRMLDFARKHDVDVLVPKMVGVGGRVVQGAVYRKTVVDAELRQVLATLSPQKLVRRSLLDTHAIRFPEGKVRLEDGIFLSQCYLRARRVSVAADYDYYFLRTRADRTNISSRRTVPRRYMNSVEQIARTLLDKELNPKASPLWVLDLYRRKCLRTYDPERFRSMSGRTRKQWVMLHAEFAEKYIPRDLEAQLPPDMRQRAELVRNRDVAGLMQLAAR